MATNGIDCFVSHSSQNADLADKLCTLFRTALTLSAAQIRCTTVPAYAPRGGADVSISLREEIKGCSVFVAIMTEASNESAYVQAEIGARWMAEGYLDGTGYSVMLRGGSFEPSRMRGPLSDTHSLDLGSEDDLRKLVRELGERLNVECERSEAYSAALKAVVDANKALLRKSQLASPSKDPAARETTKRFLSIVAAFALVSAFVVAGLARTLWRPGASLHSTVREPADPREASAPETSAPRDMQTEILPPPTEASYSAKSAVPEMTTRHETPTERSDASGEDAVTPKAKTLPSANHAIQPKEPVGAGAALRQDDMHRETAEKMLEAVPLYTGKGRDK